MINRLIFLICFLLVGCIGDSPPNDPSRPVKMFKGEVELAKVFCVVVGTRSTLGQNLVGAVYVEVNEEWLSLPWQRNPLLETKWYEVDGEWQLLPWQRNLLLETVQYVEVFWKGGDLCICFHGCAGLSYKVLLEDSKVKENVLARDRHVEEVLNAPELGK